MEKSKEYLKASWTQKPLSLAHQEPASILAQFVYGYIRQEYGVKLADFGIQVRNASKVDLSMIPTNGSVFYYPPEAAFAVDHRTLKLGDVYAAALVSYFLKDPTRSDGCDLNVSEFEGAAIHLGPADVYRGKLNEIYELTRQNKVSEAYDRLCQLCTLFCDSARPGHSKRPEDDPIGSILYDAMSPDSRKRSDASEVAQKMAILYAKQHSLKDLVQLMYSDPSAQGLRLDPKPKPEHEPALQPTPLTQEKYAELPAGNYHYVISSDGKIIVGSQDTPHENLDAGATILAAGTFTVSKTPGKPKYSHNLESAYKDHLLSESYAMDVNHFVVAAFAKLLGNPN